MPEQPQNPPEDASSEGPVSHYPADTLGMESDEMRRLGYAVVDAVVDHLEHKDAEPAIAALGPAELLQMVGGPPPEQAMDRDESLQLLIKSVLPRQQHGDHPRYFARVPGPSSFAAVLGEWLGTGFNSIASSWPGGSGPSAIELVVVDWLRQLMGMPEGTEGLLVSGGSHASMTAFAAVRALRGEGRIYLTDQTHASLARALRLLGCKGTDLVVLDSDENFRMCPQALTDALDADEKAGHTSLMVVATAGSTNTGAIDPLEALADLCSARDIWLHVDGAYGAPAALCASTRETLGGLRRADSLVLDPHKWFFQPYDAGCLLIRPGALEASFSMNPEYLQDVQSGDSAIDFRNRGFELSRRARALKMWLSLRSYGVARFRQAIARGIALAEFAEGYLCEKPERWEVVTPAQIGIICFALRGAEAADHLQRAQALSESGFACASTTVLRGRTVFRLCIINPLTTEDDIRATIDSLGAAPLPAGQT